MSSPSKRIVPKFEENQPIWELPSIDTIPGHVNPQPGCFYPDCSCQEFDDTASCKRLNRIKQFTKTIEEDRTKQGEKLEWELAFHEVREEEKWPLSKEDEFLENDEVRDSPLKFDEGFKFGFKFDEGEILDEIRDYITSTYLGHYSRGIQTTEYIMSHADSYDFLKGNAIKYLVRFGHKEGYNERDILKAIHYCILILHFSRKQRKE